jgi:type II secretion system protein H
MTPPERPVSKICRQRGFSLLELILVLAIAGLLAAVVIPSLPGALESARLKGTAGEVRAVFTLARTLAVSESRSRTVIFDFARGEYGFDAEERKWIMPEGIRLAAVRLGDADKENGVVRVRFYPDGSADETEVALSSSGGGRIRVSVDPLTGIVREGT